ncbi:MAG TPA: LEPR-XLL domain-containing protein, partial [Gemmataceae bacterium]|nr:LEPR-XLL domain-containing protein [Gemmataceae bacterium]
MLRRVGRTKPPAVAPLRVEQLEERVLLSSSGPQQNAYSPVSAPATQPAMQAHQAGPADLAGSPAAVT